jgi:hypothetical protein
MKERETERERKKKREREIEKERERERTRERERPWSEWRVRSFAFGNLAVLIFNRTLSSHEQTTISETQKRQKTFFSYIGHNSSENLDNQYF